MSIHDNERPFRLGGIARTLVTRCLDAYLAGTIPDGLIAVATALPNPAHLERWATDIRAHIHHSQPETRPIELSILDWTRLLAFCETLYGSSVIGLGTTLAETDTDADQTDSDRDLFTALRHLQHHLPINRALLLDAINTHPPERANPDHTRRPYDHLQDIGYVRVEFTTNRFFNPKFNGPRVGDRGTIIEAFPPPELGNRTGHSSEYPLDDVTSAVIIAEQPTFDLDYSPDGLEYDWITGALKSDFRVIEEHLISPWEHNITREFSPDQRELILACLSALDTDPLRVTLLALILGLPEPGLTFWSPHTHRLVHDHSHRWPTYTLTRLLVVCEFMFFSSIIGIGEHITAHTPNLTDDDAFTIIRKLQTSLPTDRAHLDPAGALRL